VAMIKCPECGKEIPDNSPVCPYCHNLVSDAQMATRQEKKRSSILVPLLAVLDALVLAGTIGLLAFGITTSTVIDTSTAQGTYDYARACRSISRMMSSGNANDQNSIIPSEPLLLDEPISAAEQDPEPLETGTEPDIQPEAPPAAADTTQGNEQPQQAQSQPQQATSPGNSTSQPEPNPPPVSNTNRSASSNAYIPSSAVNLPGNTEVYVSDSGKKIHSISDCSGMKYYKAMSLDTANANNFEYCNNCW